MSGEATVQPGAEPDDAPNENKDDSSVGDEFESLSKAELKRLAKEQIVKIEKSRFCCCLGCSWQGGLKWAYAILLFYGLYIAYTNGVRVENENYESSFAGILYTIELINGIAIVGLSMLGFFGLSTNDLRSLSQTFDKMLSLRVSVYCLAFESIYYIVFYILMVIEIYSNSNSKTSSNKDNNALILMCIMIVTVITLLIWRTNTNQFYYGLKHLCKLEKQISKIEFEEANAPAPAAIESMADKNNSNNKQNKNKKMDDNDGIDIIVSQSPGSHNHDSPNMSLDNAVQMSMIVNGKQQQEGDGAPPAFS